MAKTLREKRINRIIYISLGSAITIVILFIVFFNIFTGKKNNEMQIGKNMASNENTSEEASSSIGKTVEELANYEELNEEDITQVKVADNKTAEEQTSSVNSNENVEAQISNENIDNNENEQVNNSTNVANVADVDTTIELAEANATIGTEVQEPETVQDPTFIMPVDGEIVKHYGKEKLIYSDTLKEWTTHLGIDIKAEKTTIVKSAADGTVKSIKNDPRYGLTIVVEHQNGFSSVYANLLTAEFVVAGETVKAGQTLGTVGNSATFEILDDAHLHFEILKDSNPIDPEMYIK